MTCPDCGSDRRTFLKTAGLGAVALAASPAPRRTGSSETLVTTLFKSLTPEQRKTVALAFDRTPGVMQQNPVPPTPHYWIVRRFGSSPVSGRRRPCSRSVYSALSRCSGTVSRSREQ